MTLQQLKYFIELSEELHFTKAADNLYVSQAAFSYSISSLEEELGTKLFERTKKSVSLTLQGRLFLPYAKQMFLSLDSGIKKLHSYQNFAKDTVRIAYTRAIAFGQFPEKLHQFCTLYPEVQIELISTGSTEEALKNLHDGKADLALSYAVGYNMRSFPVYTQNLQIAVSKNHPLADKETIELTDILHEEFVTGTQKGVMRDHLMHIFDRSNMKPHISYTSEDAWTQLMYVTAGKAIALIPEGAYNVPHVICKTLNHPISRHQVFLSCLPDTPLKAGVKTMIDFFVDSSAVIISDRPEVTL